MTSKRELIGSISAMREEHRQLASVCQLLEDIADELPHPRVPLCTRAVQLLTALLPKHHASEEALFRDLRRDGKYTALAERIISLHHEDEDLAHQITTALEELQETGETPEPHMLGYLLRCFFSGYRRSMLIEELALEACLGPAA